uniref:MYB-CC type transcription factor LHEQLE-containing domain-containing protein n=1 Tax=Oryza punctata TaxID=4537 RepID=A0A0E0K6T2_ORYPU
MGWAHETVAMEELLGLVRGFVDVLVLAGGHTSSGAAATWRSGDVKKALQWALFFEEVFKNLRDNGQYDGSARELDAALVQLTSSPNFPKGIEDIRSKTLSTARYLVVKHFLKTTSVENLGAVLQAVVEMDMDGISASSERNVCQEYVQSILDTNLPSLMRTKNARDVGHSTSSDEFCEESLFMGNSQILLKELQKNLDSGSCISLAEKGLSTLLKSMKKNSFGGAGSTSCTPATAQKAQIVDKFILWKQWRAKCLSYLLDERTIRIMSGANLIFNAPKEQWMGLFEPLKDSSQSGIVEVMELCLLGLVARQWNSLIESFMSHTFSSFPISKQYADLHQLLQGTTQDECQDKLLGFKEMDICEYATQSLESEPYILWLLPPVLTAAAMPPRSSLFKKYLVEIDKQLSEAASKDRPTSTMNQLRNGKVPRYLSPAITVVPALSEVAFPSFSEHRPSYIEREQCGSSINSFDASTPMCMLASNFTSDLYINNSELPNGKLSSESYAIDTSGCDSSLLPTQSLYKGNPSSLRMVYPKVSEQNSWSQEPLPGPFVCPTSVDFFDQQDMAIFDQQIQDNIAASPSTNLAKQNEWFSSGTSLQYLESSVSAGSVLKAVDATSTTPSNYPHCHAQRNTSNPPNFNELCSDNIASSNIAPTKPRMRWTPELHERFVDAVNKLGGSESWSLILCSSYHTFVLNFYGTVLFSQQETKATPKAVQKVMKVEGLTIYHKYRTVHHRPELSDGESAKSGQMDEISSQPLKGMETTCEGLRVQIGLQKQLHEQLEIQRKLQLQVEEHSKYLAMIIAKQSESLRQLGALPRSLDAPTQVLDNRETCEGQAGDADSAEQKPEK